MAKTKTPKSTKTSKANKDESIFIRLDADLLARLKREAERQDRPMAYVARALIAKGLPEPK